MTILDKCDKEFLHKFVQICGEQRSTVVGGKNRNIDMVLFRETTSNLYNSTDRRPRV